MMPYYALLLLENNFKYVLDNVVLILNKDLFPRFVRSDISVNIYYDVNIPYRLQFQNDGSHSLVIYAS